MNAATVLIIARPGPLRDLLVSGLVALADQRHQTVAVVSIDVEGPPAVAAWCDAVAQQTSDLLIVCARWSIRVAAPEVRLRVARAALSQRRRRACKIEPYASLVADHAQRIRR